MRQRTLQLSLSGSHLRPLPLAADRTAAPVFAFVSATISLPSTEITSSTNPFEAGMFDASSTRPPSCTSILKQKSEEKIAHYQDPMPPVVFVPKYLRAPPKINNTTCNCSVLTPEASRRDRSCGRTSLETTAVAKSSNPEDGVLLGYQPPLELYGTEIRAPDSTQEFEPLAEQRVRKSGSHNHRVSFVDEVPLRKFASVGKVESLASMNKAYNCNQVCKTAAGQEDVVKPSLASSSTSKKRKKRRASRSASVKTSEKSVVSKTDRLLAGYPTEDLTLYISSAPVLRSKKVSKTVKRKKTLPKAGRPAGSGQARPGSRNVSDTTLTSVEYLARDRNLGRKRRKLKRRRSAPPVDSSAQHQTSRALLGDHLDRILQRAKSAIDGRSTRTSATAESDYTDYSKKISGARPDNRELIAALFEYTTKKLRARKRRLQKARLKANSTTKHGETTGADSSENKQLGKSPRKHATSVEQNTKRKKRRQVKHDLPIAKNNNQRRQNNNADEICFGGKNLGFVIPGKGKQSDIESGAKNNRLKNLGRKETGLENESKSMALSPGFLGVQNKTRYRLNPRKENRNNDALTSPDETILQVKNVSEHSKSESIHAARSKVCSNRSESKPLAKAADVNASGRQTRSSAALAGSVRPQTNKTLLEGAAFVDPTLLSRNLESSKIMKTKEDASSVRAAKSSFEGSGINQVSQVLEQQKVTTTPAVGASASVKLKPGGKNNSLVNSRTRSHLAHAESGTPAHTSPRRNDLAHTDAPGGSRDKLADQTPQSTQPSPTLRSPHTMARSTSNAFVRTRRASRSRKTKTGENAKTSQQLLLGTGAASKKRAKKPRGEGSRGMSRNVNVNSTVIKPPSGGNEAEDLSAAFHKTRKSRPIHNINNAAPPAVAARRKGGAGRNRNWNSDADTESQENSENKAEDGADTESEGQEVEKGQETSANDPSSVLSPSRRESSTAAEADRPPGETSKEQLESEHQELPRQRSRKRATSESAKEENVPKFRGWDDDKELGEHTMTQLPGYTDVAAMLLKEAAKQREREAKILGVGLGRAEPPHRYDIDEPKAYIAKHGIEQLFTNFTTTILQESPMRPIDHMTEMAQHVDKQTRTFADIRGRFPILTSDESMERLRSKSVRAPSEAGASSTTSAVSAHRKLSGEPDYESVFSASAILEDSQGLTADRAQKLAHSGHSGQEIDKSMDSPPEPASEAISNAEEDTSSGSPQNTAAPESS